MSPDAAVGTGHVTAGLKRSGTALRPTAAAGAPTTPWPGARRSHRHTPSIKEKQR